MKRLPEIWLLFQTHFHREAYAASRSALLILKPVLMCGVPEEAIVKREKEEKEREKPGQMKNIVRLYDRFFEPRQSRQKAPLEQAGVEEDSKSSPAKNHKSRPIKRPLLRVVRLWTSDMLLSRGELFAVHIFRGNRSQERLQDTALKYGCA